MPFAYNSIYEWKRTGCLPSLEYLNALADYFKVPIDYLLGRTDDRTMINK
jgi:transcriptional regulator with XRE-family HTH domain